MSDITEKIPPFLWELLQKEYPNDCERIIKGYVRRPVTFRANTMKASAEEVEEALEELKLSFERAAFFRDGFLLLDGDETALKDTALYKEGKIYLQSFSSMLPPLFLAPQAGESVLDMAAAPGGKTTELFALSGGKALITACEKDGVRFDRLRFNLARQGATRVSAVRADALKLDDFLRFDKILLDAPCSGSGTIISDEGTTISQKLVENSARLQRSLLKKGLKLLKKGGKLLYSTCSVLKEENEEVVKEALYSGAELLPVTPPEGVPVLPSMAGTLTVCPDEKFEGFFLALLQKK